MKKIADKYTKAQVKSAAEVKAIFFDVDGVLTSGGIFYDDGGREIKRFNVKDGQIISYLKKDNILTGAISGRESSAVSRRCSELRIDFCHQLILDKAEVIKKMARHYGLKKKEIAYIGDDINDLGAFAASGFSVCPADALDYIKERVHLVTRAKGGEGVLREVADLVLAARGSFEKLVFGKKKGKS